MNDDRRDLYQALILEHGRRPRNFRTIPAARAAEGYNPLCGDRVTVFLLVRDGVVQDASFQGAGCAICVASASMMTEQLRARPVVDADLAFACFHGMVAGGQPPDPRLGKLAVFAGVREYPSRIKCATLPWHALRSALHPESPPTFEEPSP